MRDPAGDLARRICRPHECQPERLPFEGGGAISTWRLELPNDVPQFDFETIADVILHVRYTAREAGHLRAPAVAVLTEDVLTDPGGLLQLFSLPNDFPDAWQAFGSATNDATRVLSVGVNRDHFPYWVRRTGMDDVLTATFAVIDWERNKLTVAPAAVALTGDAQTGWQLTVDQASPVFAFLKKHASERPYLTLASASAPS